MKKIGIFGITGNPAHAGHVSAAVQAAHHYDEVWVSPSFVHAYNKPQMLAYEHRVSIARLVFDELVPENLKSKIFVRELDLEYYRDTQITPVYTYNLMKYLQKNVGVNCEFDIILGADNKENVERYYNYSQIERDFHLFYASEDTKVHSTNIRHYVGLTSGSDNMTYLKSAVGEKAAAYIATHHLYQNSTKV